MSTKDIRHKILLTRVWPERVVAHLSARYDVAMDAHDRPLDREALIAAMRTFDALCPTVSDRIDAGILETPDATVRIVANYGVGYEHIDTAAAQRAGLVVSNTPDVLTAATAELALLLMLMTSRRAGEGERELRADTWTGWRPTHLMGASLSGKVLGLVGFGRIAQATARLARNALGMRVAYHSRRNVAAPSDLAGAEYHAALDTLLAAADVVSLHCPGGAGTRHLMNASRIALLKPSAFLINTARGSIVDEEALAAALQEKRIAGAGLDVYEREPQIHPALRACENAVLLPHLGSATEETRVAMGLRAAANLDAFFDGKPVPDRVV
jgi:lactate dehydrogenase-like 2-hydroxyacid dehydrogenase